MSNYGLYISGLGKFFPPDDGDPIDDFLPYIAKYDNNSFIDNQTPGAGDAAILSILSFANYNNQLYVCDGIGALFEYDFINNTTEIILDKDTLLQDGETHVTCLTVYDGDLYFGGFLEYDGDDGKMTASKLYFAKFNSDGKYTNLSTTKGFNQDKDKDLINTLWNMTVYDDDLYISGVSSGTFNFGKYNASKNEFTDLSNIIKIDGLPFIQAMTVYDGDLYIGGFSFGKYNASKNEFTDLSNVLPDNAEINTMTVYDGDLYVGGGNLDDVYQMYVGKYDKKNNKVDSITKGLITNVDGSINTMSVYDGDLYIGGGGSYLIKDTADNFPNIEGIDPEARRTDESSQYVAKYNKTDNSFTSITGGLVKDKGSSILSMYNFEEDKKSNLALMIGVGVAGGIVVLAVIFFLLYKFVF